MRLTDHRTGRSATLDGTLCREILEDVLYPVLLWSIDGDEAGDKEQSFAELVLILSDGETSQRVMFYEDGILALNGEVFETDGEGIALIEYLIDCFWNGQKG